MLHVSWVRLVAMLAGLSIVPASHYRSGEGERATPATDIRVALQLYLDMRQLVMAQPAVLAMCHVNREIAAVLSTRFRGADTVVSDPSCSGQRKYQHGPGPGRTVIFVRDIRVVGDTVYIASRVYPPMHSWSEEAALLIGSRPRALGIRIFDVAYE